MTFDQWLALAREFGVPIAILGPITAALMWFVVKVLWMLYSAGAWVGMEFMTPIKERHLEFLDGMQRTQERLAETQEKQAATAIALAEAFRQHDEWERELAMETANSVAVIRKDVDVLEIRVKNLEVPLE